MKICKICQKEKEEKDFPTSRGKYKKRACKECTKKIFEFKKASGLSNVDITVKACIICKSPATINVKDDTFCKSCYDFYVKASVEQAEKLAIYKFVSNKFPFLFKWRHMIPFLKANENEVY